MPDTEILVGYVEAVSKVHISFHENYMKYAFRRFEGAPVRARPGSDEYNNWIVRIQDQFYFHPSMLHLFSSIFTNLDRSRYMASRIMSSTLEKIVLASTYLVDPDMFV